MTLTVETRVDAVRVTVRRAWWTPAAILAALQLLLSLALSLLTLLLVAGAVASVLGQRPEATGSQDDARLLAAQICLAVVGVVGVALIVRWTLPSLLAVLCGDAFVEARAHVVTVRRRNPLRRWEKSFDAGDEAAVVVSAARRGSFARLPESWVEPRPLGVVVGLSIDGARNEWVCRLAPGLPTSTADRLVRALAGPAGRLELTLPVPAASGDEPGAAPAAR